ncbi:MAG: DNA methylase [Betaproteobacteria bacterium RIFCSPLOWO2_02_FULL_63_19]|nr:MAG: DNA methylase [Betaproteobacteria bacterium RIFCSPLOWO2_02_FULL_63_19]
MALKKKTARAKNGASKNRPIESYEHRDKQRVNNPPVGLVTPDTDPDAGAKQTYAYDPHLDPQLVWAGKAEHTSFELPTVSLHVHERIDPRTIIEAVRKRYGNGGERQMALFETERQEPLRHAIEFYQHKHGWSNRLIAGDSLLVMNSLLEKEGMAGKVQMIYIDPPYGIRYGSNFQPFVNKRDVKDGKDEDLTAEPEQIRAFRDTWELGIHSYLTYLRDRLLLARELLTESGSVFVQISDENVHHVRELMDEVFGAGNFIALVPFRKKTMPFGTVALEQMNDFSLFYAKSKPSMKYLRLFVSKDVRGDQDWVWYLDEENHTHRMTKEQHETHFGIPAESRIFRLKSLEPSGPMAAGMFNYEFQGRMFRHPTNGYATTPEGMKLLEQMNRLQVKGNLINYRLFLDDYPISALLALWNDTVGADDKRYAVQTNTEVVKRCLLMTTDPGDLVFDPTCGSGTTAYVAEQWGRRWITCDTSRVALTLGKQRLMTAVFDYYELAHPEEGVGSGFRYKTVPHVTLKSIANNPDIKEGMTREQIDAAIARHAPQETLYDQPFVDNKRTRVSGPFTVEAVPAPAVKAVDELLEGAPQPADASIARSGETLRQGEWRDELLRAGIRGKAGQHIRFARLEPLPGCRWLHADGETRPNDEGADRVREKGAAYSAQRIVVSFGPEHAPLERRQVAQAIEEAQTLVPKPKLIVFAAFQFDPEAARDIDETHWPGVTLLKAQMNADLLTDDLKKKRSSNESFWLIGQPDVRVECIAKGEDKGKFRVSVHGFDYYNTKTGGIESGGEDRIAVWLLDTDYDGRSLYPRQVFFPMAGEKEGWARLAKNLKAEIDEQLIEAYRGTASLPFEPGGHKRIAVKIVDDRGIESLKVMALG